MQPGLDSAHRNPRKILNFRQFIALCIVQQHDKAVLVTELVKGPVECLQSLDTLAVISRIIGAGQPRKSFAGEEALFDGNHAPARKTAPVIDKQVVHDPAQPRARLIEAHQFIELAERLDQQFLKQIFGVRFATGEATRQSKQAVEVRAYKALKNQLVFHGAHSVAECSGPMPGDKEALGTFAIPVVGFATS